MAELGMAKLRELAKDLGYWPASTDEESVERPVHIIIVRGVTRDQAEGLQFHVLPTDDPLRALNILREAAGLQPLPDEHDDQSG
jgi:hypothetical protein